MPLYACLYVLMYVYEYKKKVKLHFFFNVFVYMYHENFLTCMSINVNNMKKVECLCL